MHLFVYIGISGIAITLFTLSLLFLKEKKQLTDFLLIGWLASLGSNQAYFLYSDANFKGGSFFIDLTGMGMVLIHTPLLYLFVKYAFRQEIPLKEIRHLIHFFLFVTVYGMYYLVHPDSVRVQDGFLSFSGESPFFLHQYGLYFALVAGSYTLAAWFKIRQRQEEMDQFYSNQAREVFLWMQKWILAAVLFFVTTWLFIQLSLRGDQLSTATVFPVVSSFITVYIYYIGLIGIRYARVFLESMPEIHLKQITEDVNTFEDDDDLHLPAQRIAEIMETQKPYLNPDLTLPELAHSCGLSTVKTSRVINRVLGKNFYTFVNEYRAALFIRNLNNAAYGHLSLIGLAYECGFKSKSTFNKFFKAYTGLTPSRFRKKQSQKSPSV